MKNLKKKLLAGGMALALILGGYSLMSSGGPGEPPIQATNTATQTFHC